MFGELETLVPRLTERRKVAAAYAVNGPGFKIDLLYHL
jgi:hypothetical protein